MSERKTPKLSTQRLLWGMTAGRCEKCGRLIYRHPLGDTIGNFAQVAHNNPVGKRGPRAEYKKLNHNEDVDRVENLLLLCYDCHREIDFERPSDFSPSLLTKMKHDFEEFIIQSTNKETCSPSIVIRYSPNLHDKRLKIVDIRNALFPDKYVKEEFELNLQNSAVYPGDGTDYWELEERNLVRNFTKIEARIDDVKFSDTDISVFSIGPIPLLAKLGELLSNKRKIDVYQLKKTPPSWKWDGNLDSIEYRVSEIQKVPNCKNIILILSLSGKISLNDVRSSIDFDIGSIYEISINNPNDDYLRTKQHLDDFVNAYRLVRELIVSGHGKDMTIHIFAAVPVSVAVEIGRHRNPSSDPPAIVYNYNRNKYTKGVTLGR